MAAETPMPAIQQPVGRDEPRRSSSMKRLIVKPGAAHGWPDFGKDLPLLADWFDQHLKKQSAPAAPAKPAAGSN
jgi:hypothetical protein